jgi:hypothetical protein
MGQQVTGRASGWTGRGRIGVVVPIDAEQRVCGTAPSRHAIASRHPALSTPWGICA